MALHRVSRVPRKPVIQEVNRPVGRISRTRPVRVAAPAQKPLYVVDFDLPWGSLFQLYLMNSYLYYRMNRTVITDHAYDKLCRILLAGWRTAKHQHKHLITISDLRATTGYAIEYPRMVVGGAMYLLDNYREI